MVVRFSKQKSNYNQQNIVDIIATASIKNPLLYQLMMSPTHTLLVQGDIHNSQYTYDNIKNNYWFKLKGYDENGVLIPELRAAHIYVCFVQMVYDYKKQQYKTSACYNPPPKKGTDIADISGVVGLWQYVRITYGTNPIFIAPKKNIKRKTPKKVSKKLEIIDPKTGKPIIIKK